MTVNPLNTAGQLFCIFLTVIHTSHKAVLKSDPSACFVEVVSAGIQNLIHGIFIGDRHQFLTFLIIRRMKRKRQRDLQFLFCQIIHFRNNATGRNRYIPLTDAKSVFVGKYPDKTDKIIIIVHRLTGSHHYHVCHPFSGICLYPVDLVQHLGRFQASGQASDGRSTEPAAHTAPYL